MVGYSPCEGGEERDRFWNDVGRIVDKVGNGYRLCIIGDQMDGLEIKQEPA